MTRSSKIVYTFSIPFLLLVLLWSNFCFAQQAQYHFNLVVPPDSNNSKITGITQDTKGYIWLADQGNGCLIRYDGYNMRKYTYDPSKPATSLGGGGLHKLYADSEGFIWLGAGTVLDQFDTRTGQFRHYKNDPKDTTSFNGSYINPIIRDHEGFVWIGTDHGLEQLDVKTGKFKHYRNIPNDPKSISSNTIWTIYEDRHGDIWIGTGYPWANPDDGGLNRLDRKTGTFTRYMHDPADPYSLEDNKVGAIFEDTRGIFWVGTKSDGLHTMDREKGIFERHLYDAVHPTQLSRPPLKNGGDIITFIQEDSAGVIWIGTNKSGINAYDPISQKISHIGADAAFPDTAAWTAFCSRDGELWIASEPVGNEVKHLYRTDPFLKSLKHIRTNFNLSVFHEDSKGSIWMGTFDSGLALLPSDEAGMIKIIHLPPVLHPGTFEKENFVTSIYEDQKGIFWLGSTDGVLKFNASTGEFSRFQHDSGNADLRKNVVTSIMEDHKGMIWFASFCGLSQLNQQTGAIKHYRHNSKDSGSINSDLLLQVTVDHSGGIWVSTFDHKGLDRLENNGDIFKHYLPNFTVPRLCIDDSGIVWAGTNHGLYRYDKLSDQFNIFDIQSSIGTLAIGSVIEDRSKNLWLNTSTAIFKIDSTRSGIREYAKKASENSSTTLFETSKGKILAGGENGFFILSPGEHESRIIAPLILLTDLYVDDKLIIPGKGSPILQPVDEVPVIRLSYDQNIFSFRFLAIHYSAPEENEIYYKLEGYDGDWRKAGPEKSASYFKLPPADYTFRLKAKNKYGLWSERSVAVIVNPPWWRSWWAYILYGILLVAVGYAVYQDQKKRIIRFEKEKTREKELEQAKEIQKAYQELKTTQAQLVQSEKMASLGELTAGIAHEIQNPLNFVNNFSDVNKELIGELKENIDKGKFDEAKSIANDIEANEEKINHHGKRADGIVKGMLRHARTSSGMKEPTDINSLTQEYLQLAYHGFRARDKDFHAIIKTDFDRSLKMINIIPQDIGRVLLNIFDNAFFAISEKKKQAGNLYQPMISVTTSLIPTTNAAPVEAEICITDNGNGIPEKIREKIFQPFFTTKPTGQGTGLGLSLSYDMVKAHGGQITAENIAEGGVRFVIKLPIS